MSNGYDYKSNANRQIKKYNSAIAYLKKAKQDLEESISKLKTIEGVESCEQLKNDINKKIGIIDDKIQDITNVKNSVKKKSISLAAEQEKMEQQNEI